VPCPRAKITVILALSIILASTPALADVLVLQSSTTAGTAGTIIRSGAKLEVPVGARMVILHADGHTQDVVGPTHYSAPIAANGDTSLLAAYTAMFRTRADPLRLGGVRADTVAACLSVDANPWIAIAETWDMGCHSQALARLDATLAVPK
jgi:hypothetical protein